MDLSKLYQEMHKRIELKEDHNITQEEMALKIGCSLDTYGADMRGNRASASTVRFLTLLNLLDDAEIVSIVRKGLQESS